MAATTTPGPLDLTTKMACPGCKTKWSLLDWVTHPWSAFLTVFASQANHGLCPGCALAQRWFVPPPWRMGAQVEFSTKVLERKFKRQQAQIEGPG